MYYEKEYLVDSRDIDPWYHCRPSGLLGALQEAAVEAACALHVSRDETMAKYHCFWMLVRMWYRLNRPLSWGDQVTIRTWHREDKGATMYRDYDLFVDGEAVGECVSAWVLASMDTRQIIRLATVYELDGTGGGELCKSKKLSKLRLPQDLELAGRRKLRYSDTDLNGHVNNTRYADFACDALEMERLGPDRFLSSMQIGYLAECRPGEELLLWTKEQDGTHFVQGMDEGGKSRFEAALIFGEVLP